MAFTLQGQAAGRPIALQRTFAWVLGCAAIGSALAYVFWPPVDTALLIACALVLGLAGAVLAAMLVVRVAYRRSAKSTQQRFKTTVDGLLEAAAEGAWPPGPLM